MNILIGYYQRSGSTLLQHLLNEHDKIRSYSDLSSLVMLPALLLGYEPKQHVCIKPLDIVYTISFPSLYNHFDKFIWLARDPRDSYLSALEVNYAYNFWFPGRKIRGIDVGLLQRWKLIYQQYFRHPKRWHLIRYEDLVEKPQQTLEALYQYLEVPPLPIREFSQFQWLSQGGDPKLRKTSRIHQKSKHRYEEEMSFRAQKVFLWFLRKEMRQLGYDVCSKPEDRRDVFHAQDLP